MGSVVELMAEKDYKVSEASLAEGYLWMQEGVFSRWAKSYVMLLNDKLQVTCSFLFSSFLRFFITHGVVQVFKFQVFRLKNESLKFIEIPTFF